MYLNNDDVELAHINIYIYGVFAVPICWSTTTLRGFFWDMNQHKLAGERTNNDTRKIGDNFST